MVDFSLSGREERGDEITRQEVGAPQDERWAENCSRARLAVARRGIGIAGLRSHEPPPVSREADAATWG
jgi:hypothetical protein